MTHFWELLFWMSVAWLAYVYFGYALCLWMLGAFRNFHGEKNENYFPKVSVLISARNEEKDIEWKVRETLGWDYPPDALELLIASDASEDRTDGILESIRDPRLRYIRIEPRVGKNEALNRLAKMVTGEILFFTDANSHIGQNSVKSMVRHFADARVGCVTGIEHTIENSGKGSVEAGARAYLEYEAVINRMEARLGSVLVCDGSIFCIRRNLFSDLDRDLANDLETPVRIGSRRLALLFEPEAESFEKSTSSMREEFNRRRRICGQGILGMWRLRASLKGLRAWQFISRKLLRWLCLVPLLGVLAASIGLASRPFFVFFLGVQLVCYVFAVIGAIQSRGHGHASRLFSLPLFFMLANVAAIWGLVESCRGRRYATWEIPSLSRGGSETSRSAVSNGNPKTIVLDVSQDGAVRSAEVGRDGR